MTSHATNSQIVDSVCETELEVLGHSPKLAMAYLDTLMAETTGLMMNQAVVSQQNAQTAGNASLTATCAKILRVPTNRPLPQPATAPKSYLALANQGDVGAGIQGHFSKAKSAINNLKNDLRKAEFNHLNACELLDSLADLAKPAGA